MKNKPPEHAGCYKKTYRRASKYLSDVMGSEVDRLVYSTDRISRADQNFASRHRNLSDDFSYAEAYARCAAILHTVEENCSKPNANLIYEAGKMRTKAYDALIKWQDSAPYPNNSFNKDSE